MEVIFLSDMLDVGGAKRAEEAYRLAPVPTASASALDLTPAPYFRFKRPIDVLVAATMMIILSLVRLLVSGLAFLDVGSPVVFGSSSDWGQRASASPLEISHTPGFIRPVWPKGTRRVDNLMGQTRLSRAID
jgi:hypothetical protein